MAIFGRGYPIKKAVWIGRALASSGGATNTPLTLTATCTTTASLIRRTAKTLLATCTSTSTLIRSVAKTILATCTTTLTGVASKAFLRTLTATCTTTASLFGSKSYGRLLVATVTTTASVIRSTAKTLAATCTTTATLIRSVAKRLTATCTTTLTGVARKCILYTQSLLATCTTTSIVGTLKSLYTAVLQSALLSSYKPNPYPTLPGSDPRYILAELQRIANAMEAHNRVTKDLDERLTAAGF